MNTNTTDGEWVDKATIKYWEEQVEAYRNQTIALERRLEGYEQLRPVWACGWTEASMAAQASSYALSDLWKLLEASDQTQAVARLKDLLKTEEELACLEAGGVDNWEWYSESLKEHYEKYEIY